MDTVRNNTLNLAIKLPSKNPKRIFTNVKKVKIPIFLEVYKAQ